LFAQPLDLVALLARLRDSVLRRAHFLLGHGPGKCEDGNLHSKISGALVGRALLPDILTYTLRIRNNNVSWRIDTSSVSQELPGPADAGNFSASACPAREEQCRAASYHAPRVSSPAPVQGPAAPTRCSRGCVWRPFGGSRE